MFVVIRISLDKALNRLGMSRYELAKRTGVQYQIIDNYYKNRVKRYDSFVIERICDALECEISDIIEYKKDERTD
ncbi:MAG: helix-turn-helix transcriptional regulator [Ruminococcaceae bacterium]|nr:helix-turn-helix transcriptional regulator [Oscillospiraceae bacterium]